MFRNMFVFDKKWRLGTETVIQNRYIVQPPSPARKPFGSDPHANISDWRPKKDEGDDSFVSFVITHMVCKDPWGRLVHYISFK